jgi:creatinine amidohydrolase
MDSAMAEYPHGLPHDSLLSMEGKLPFAWTTRDLSVSGTLGDPTTASAEKGDRILDSLVQGWVRVFQDIYRFQQPKAAQ